MRRGIKTWLGRLALAVLLTGALAYVPFHLYARSGFARAQTLAGELVALRARNANLAAENRRLQREAESLRDDPSAIERVARVELGWIRPGEIVVDLSSGMEDEIVSGHASPGRIAFTTTTPATEPAGPEAAVAVATTTTAAGPGAPRRRNPNAGPASLPRAFRRGTGGRRPPRTPP